MQCVWINVDMNDCIDRAVGLTLRTLDGRHARGVSDASR